MKWFLVFVGSGLGGCFRLFTSEFAARHFGAAYPFGTFISNVVACLLLGLVLGLFETTKVLDNRALLFLAVGICGGFSTFSTFSHETLQLLQNQKIAEALGYVVASIVLGLAAVWGGYALVQLVK